MNLVPYSRRSLVDLAKGQIVLYIKASKLFVEYESEPQVVGPPSTY